MSPYRQPGPFPSIDRAIPWRFVSLVAVAIAWAVASARVPSRRDRAALAVGLAGAAFPMYAAVAAAAHGTFARYFPGHGGLDGLVVAFALLPPLTVVAIGAAVRARTTWPWRAASVALWALALPLGVLWLSVFDPPFADALHAIKTGAAIPRLVIALGLPLTPRER